MSDSTQPRNGHDSAHVGDRNPIDVLADSFLARLRGGEYPSISEYTVNHPELAEEIRSVFPTLAILEQGGEGLTRSQPLAPTPSAPTQIGEYQILREVGRGGMGIVYEAEHDTMRRRVALKVLPVTAALDQLQLQRFYLEARVAGRLHHTNIVPVFEVGSNGHYHYYAMQFIQGQSLDVVFNELRQIQGVVPRQLERASATLAEPVDELGKTLAAGLVSGQFTLPHVATEEDLRDRPLPKHVDGALPDPSHSVRDSAPTERSHIGSLGKKLGDGDAPDASSSVSADLNTSTTQRDDYFCRVARIGLQIADALSYAHGQGILHRDIKPSNIILDTAGIAWVADFGLAKDEDGDLTRSGDIVGTFRYMAPERFEGHTDTRSDIYGLGLTLYELCTLRNAFRGTDRARLVREICHGEPVRPRKLNPQVPRDLETIILKAMEKRPGHRYQAARHMAEDLRLFLADHPIKARRSSTIERTWRWCRRNPQQAVLGACVLLLLCIVTVGSLSFAYFADKKAEELDRKAEELADSEQVATQRLYQSLRGSAEASRFSGRPGQHFSSLDDVASAVEILPQLGREPDVVEREMVELRNAAIAAMSLPDLRVVQSWGKKEPRSPQATFNPDYAAYARVDRVGNVSIRNVADGRETCDLPAPGGRAAVLHMKFSPDGRYLAVKYNNTESGQLLRVWDTVTAQSVVSPSIKLNGTAAFDIDAESSWIALGNAKLLTLFRLDNGEIVRELPLPAVARDVRVCPTSGNVAVLLSGRRSVQVWDSDHWEPRKYDVETIIRSMQWRPHASELALGFQDGSLSLVRPVDTPEPQLQVERDFEGHNSRIVSLHFSPSGDLLISQSWDGTTRLWEAAFGRQLLRMEGRHLLESGFSKPNGRYVGMNDGQQLQLCEIARATPLRILRNPESTARRWSADIDPTGRWLASAKNDGVEIWDIASGQLLQVLPTQPSADGTSKDAAFLPDGSGLLLGNIEGARLYPIASNADPSEGPRFLTPRTISASPTSWASMSQTGELAAFRADLRGAWGLVLSLRDPSDIVRIGPHSGLDHVEISPNGRWVATTTWNGQGGIHLWDAKTGDRLTSKPLEAMEPKANVIFSPDSTRLVASTTQHHISWDVETMRTIFRVERDARDEWPGPLAYSPDRTLLTVASSRFVLRLLDPDTGQEVGVLDAPSDAGFHACSFGPNGKMLAAASDTDIHLWDLANVRRQLANIGLGF